MLLAESVTRGLRWCVWQVPARGYPLGPGRLAGCAHALRLVKNAGRTFVQSTSSCVLAVHISLERVQVALTSQRAGQSMHHQRLAQIYGRWSRIELIIRRVKHPTVWQPKPKWLYPVSKWVLISSALTPFQSSSVSSETQITKHAQSLDLLHKCDQFSVGQFHRVFRGVRTTHVKEPGISSLNVSATIARACLCK
jgi:hypothetical protein